MLLRLLSVTYCQPQFLSGSAKVQLRLQAEWHWKMQWLSSTSILLNLEKLLLPIKRRSHCLRGYLRQVRIGARATYSKFQTSRVLPHNNNMGAKEINISRQPSCPKEAVINRQIQWKRERWWAIVKVQIVPQRCPWTKPNLSHHNSRQSWYMPKKLLRLTLISASSAHSWISLMTKMKRRSLYHEKGTQARPGNNYSRKALSSTVRLKNLAQT